MAYYRSVGEVPPKRHTQFRQPDGSLYAEELMGQEGFSSDSSLLYHRHLPTAIVDAAEFDRRLNIPGLVHSKAVQYCEVIRTIIGDHEGRSALPASGPTRTVFPVATSVKYKRLPMALPGVPDGA